MTWKNLKTPIKALVILAVIVGSVFSAWPVQQTIHLGLDLVGGSRLLLQLYPTAEVPQITPQIQAQTREVIDRRINGLGVAEPSISNVGSDRILVELPAREESATEAEKLLKTGRGARVSRSCRSTLLRKAERQYVDMLKTPNLPAKEKAAAQKLTSTKTAYALAGPVVYSGKDLKGAQAGYEQQGGSPIVLFQTKDPAKFGKLTTANVGKTARHLPRPSRTSRRRSSRARSTTAARSTGSFTQAGHDHARQRAQRRRAARDASRSSRTRAIGPTLGKIDLIQVDATPRRSGSAWCCSS